MLPRRPADLQSTTFDKLGGLNHRLRWVLIIDRELRIAPACTSIFATTDLHAPSSLIGPAHPLGGADFW